MVYKIYLISIYGKGGFQQINIRTYQKSKNLERFNTIRRCYFN